MQLVAYGAQDIYLTGNPQITFFKVVYRRHTNFSMEAIVQTLNGAAAAGGNSTVTISRNGDLVSKIYVTMTGATADAGILDGCKVVEEVELEIGGQRIDKHTSQWNEIWNELCTPESKALGLKSMQGCIGASGRSTTGAQTGVSMVQVPLNFWFCRNPGLALPLIALQYHEVKLKFKWATVGTTARAIATAAGVAGAQVVCDYIYLDTDERRRFAQVSHEYLIEQLQEQNAGSGDSHKLNFNHPVKELIWTSSAGTDYTNAQLKLNGHDRFSVQEREYFQLRQPFDYHTACPKQNLPTSARLTTLDRKTALDGISCAVVTDTALSDVLASLAPAVAAAAGFTYTALTGLFTMQDNTTAVVANVNLAAGDQIAITVISADGNGAVAAATDAGKTYFATIVSDPIQGDGSANGSATPGIVMTITTPTSSDLGVTAVFDSNSAGGGTTIRVYKVTNANSLESRTSKSIKRINVYSFALKPEEHQPSGTCNFSRIDNAQLQINQGVSGGNSLATSDVIYAVNYNVLRIMSGMGGLAYSN